MSLEAGTLGCPQCGAPAATEATRCEHCGARLATVACPSCFGLIFLGATFCSHCGAKVERKEMAEQTNYSCPCCQQALAAIAVGTSNLNECGKCEGVWVDKDTLLQICADRDKQVLVLGLPATAQASDTAAIENFRYRPCPACKSLMNRVNFAHCSHVVVDVCAKHGTWFDKDELRKIVEFIRAGGLDKAREREIQELEQRRSALNTDAGAGSVLGDVPTRSGSYDGYAAAIDIASAALKIFLR